MCRQARKLDISQYAGQDVHIAFRHFGTTDLFGIALELVEVKVVPGEPVSVENVRPGSGLRLFPNPASNQFTVASESIITRLEITDITGRVVRASFVNDNETRVETSGLRSGVYLVSVFTEKGVTVSRLQIQR